MSEKRNHDEIEAENEQLRDALRTVIAHYDTFCFPARGMALILEDCRKLLEEKGKVRR